MTRTPKRVAVIGIGHLGCHHARIFAGFPDVELSYVVDIIPERAQRIHASYGGVPLTDYRDVPVDDIDMVSIVTPTTTHREIAEYFLRHGVPTFVEKPLTSDSDGARRLTELSQRLQVPLYVGHIERFNPAMQYLKRHRFAYMFIEITRVHPFVPRSVDIDVMMDLMIHDLDLLRCLVDHPLRIIDAVGLPVVTDKIDAASVRVQWPGGRANLVASRVSPSHMRRWTVFATGQYTMADFMNGEVSVIRLDYNNPSSFSLQEFKLHDQREPLEMELRSFVESVRRGYPVSESLVDGREALRTIELVEKIHDVIHRDLYQELTPWVSALS